ncbi:MAG TPA: hypothetical protein VHC49_22890 [Mycobacteriales bacterium]|nr:hypothetical protein [Mycobacteriales bacterium]
MPERRRFRYGLWSGGPDPLDPPFDIRDAVDEIGDDVLAGDSPAEALRRLLRRGTNDLRGLDDLRRRVRERQREARRRGQLDGTLQEVKQLLEEAVEAERNALFPDPADAARLAEAELDSLPRDTARAVRQLSDYDWHSAEARAKYEQIKDLLRQEVLDSQFRGMKQALQNAGEQDMAAVKDMLADLNEMLAADARGEHTQEQFDEFMDKHGQFFPDDPANLDELIDSLARRAAAQQRMLASLTDEQRQELAELMSQAMSDVGLASELDRLGSQLRSARPDLPWNGQTRMRGDQPLGMGDATTALEEIADLDELAGTLEQDYPGATIDDVDPELVERALGRQAVDDLAALRRIERELTEQGFLTRENGELQLSPRAVRRLGSTALRRVFADLEASRRGGHDVTSAGSAGDVTGASRAWEFGDEQPLDVVRTVRNAVLRSGPGPVKLTVDDFEVVETERRTSAAVALLVDLSYSMMLRDTWGAAKSTALALHSLVSTRFPQDAIEVIGFSRYARPIRPTDLAGMTCDMEQGTNLQHALMLAGRHLGKHPGSEPVVLVITDGEPTAHLLPDGEAVFDWPPRPETVALTHAEVQRITRRGATINVFMLAEEPGLVHFVEGLAHRNGGRVFSPSPDRLGEYVVQDYLRARRGRRAAS